SAEPRRQCAAHLPLLPVATAPRRVEPLGPVALRCLPASGVPSDPLWRPRYVGLDEPYTEYAPKQICIKMVFRISLRGQRPSKAVEADSECGSISRTTLPATP